MNFMAIPDHIYYLCPVHDIQPVLMYCIFTCSLIILGQLKSVVQVGILSLNWYSNHVCKGFREFLVIWVNLLPIA
jgi:hypothetical protein